MRNFYDREAQIMNLLDELDSNDIARDPAAINPSEVVNPPTQDQVQGLGIGEDVTVPYRPGMAPEIAEAPEPVMDNQVVPQDSGYADYTPDIPSTLDTADSDPGRVPASDLENLLSRYRKGSIDMGKLQDDRLASAREARNLTNLYSDINKAGAIANQALANQAGYTNIKVKAPELSKYEGDKDVEKDIARSTALMDKIMKSSLPKKGNRKIIGVENPDTGRTEYIAIDPNDPTDRETLGLKGYNLKAIEDKLTGEHMDIRDLLGKKPKSSEESEKPDTRTSFEKLTSTQRKDFKKHRDTFEKETKEDRISIDKLRGLSDKQIELATTNESAAAQLGAQVAKIYEGGRLTDEDVARYVARHSIPSRITDTMKTLKDGTYSGGRAQELKESLSVFKEVLSDNLNTRALSAARKMSHDYGIPAERLVKNMYPGFSGRIKYQYSPSKDKTRIIYPDGKSEIVDGKVR